MEKIKILHCSDFHIDTPFKEFDRETSIKRKEELKETFSGIIDICIKEKVRLLLIAGDLFDGITISKNSIDFIISKLKQIENTRVFIAAGNHDPYTETSPYKMYKWPSNVHVFSNEFEECIIPELKIIVGGFSFGENYIRESKLKNIEMNSSYEYKDYAKIIVAHGGDKDFNPFTNEEIEKLNVDYLALGHIHTFCGVKLKGKTYYAYSGCPEGRGFDEVGHKGILIGEISLGYCNMNFIKTCKREYHKIILNLNDCSCYDDIKRKISSVIEGNKKTDFYKFILKGDIAEEVYINKTILKEELFEEFYYLSVEDRTSLALDYDKISKEYSVKGIFVKKMIRKIELCTDESEKEILNDALKIGVQSLLGREVNVYDN